MNCQIPLFSSMNYRKMYEKSFVAFEKRMRIWQENSTSNAERAAETEYMQLVDSNSLEAHANFDIKIVYLMLRWQFSSSWMFCVLFLVSRFRKARKMKWDLRWSRWELWWMMDLSVRRLNFHTVWSHRKYTKIWIIRQN